MDARVAEFKPLIAFKSRALSMMEALTVIKNSGIQAINLYEPLDEAEILLHNEASDSCRLNELAFHIVNLELNQSKLPLEDMLMELELEEFKLDPGNDIKVDLYFGCLDPKTAAVKLSPGGVVTRRASFDYGRIDCQMNKELADYFKMFYSGAVQIALSKRGGPIFARCQIDVKQALR